MSQNVIVLISASSVENSVKTKTLPARIVVMPMNLGPRGSEIRKEPSTCAPYRIDTDSDTDPDPDDGADFPSKFSYP